MQKFCRCLNWQLREITCKIEWRIQKELVFTKMEFFLYCLWFFSRYCKTSFYKSIYTNAKMQNTKKNLNFVMEKQVSCNGDNLLDYEKLSVWIFRYNFMLQYGLILSLAGPRLPSKETNLSEIVSRYLPLQRRLICKQCRMLYHNFWVMKMSSNLKLSGIIGECSQVC